MRVLKKWWGFFFTLMLPGLALAANQGDTVIPWTEAKDHMGEMVTVEGELVRTNDIGKITFLNFAKERGSFTVVIFSDHYDKFPSPPAEMYRGKKVQVKGVVEDYKGTPQIKVTAPGQITLLEDKASSASEKPPLVTWKEAESMVGQKAVVEGKIVATNDIGSITFLNFSAERDRFTAIVFDDYYGNFPEPPATLYRDALVQISGEITEYKGTPQIQVQSPEQVMVIKSLSAHTQGMPEIAPDDAGNYLGKEVKVTGKVVDSHQTDSAAFLNFTEDSESGFTAVIFSRSFHKFDGKPAQTFLNKKVTVQGEVKAYKGKLEIIVNGPDQIRIVE